MVCLQDQWVYCQSKVFVCAFQLRTALGMPTGPVSILPKQSNCMCISAQDSSWYAYRTSEYIAKAKYLYVHFSSGQLLVCLQDQWVYCQSKVFVCAFQLRTALGMPTGPVSILPKQSNCMCISAQDSSRYAYRTSEYIAKAKYLYEHFNSGQLLVCLQDQWVYCQSKVIVCAFQLRTALGMPTGPVSILPKQSNCMCISAQDSSWYAYRTSEYIAKAKYLYEHFNSGQLLVCLQDQWVYCQSKVFVWAFQLRTALGMPTGPVSILPKQSICMCISTQDSSRYIIKVGCMCMYLKVKYYSKVSIY